MISGVDLNRQSVCIPERERERNNQTSTRHYFKCNKALFQYQYGIAYVACSAISRHHVSCKVYPGYVYHATNEIEHGSSAYTVGNPLAKARGLSPYRRKNTCSLSPGSRFYSVVRNPETCVVAWLTLKVLNKNCSRRHFYPFYFYQS